MSKNLVFPALMYGVMKKVASTTPGWIILFFLFMKFPCVMDAQTDQCGTEFVPMPASVLNSRSNASLRGERGGIVPIRVHITRRSNGSGGVDYTRIRDQINRVNQQFSASGIRFIECEPVNYIDDSELYDFDYPYDAYDLWFYHTPAVLNINYVDRAFIEEERVFIGGYAFYPWQSYPIPPSEHYIMISTSNAYDNNTLAHELGHYFGLLHTHDSWYGVEYVNGTNCSLAGDLICDTPADPNCYGCVTSDCRYIAGGNCLQVDPLGVPYDPPTRNIMSYSGNRCAQHFTAQQNERMNSFYEGRMAYLRCGVIVPPSNDNCPGEVITSNGPCKPGTVANATGAHDAEECLGCNCISPDKYDVYYSFTAQAACHTVTVSNDAPDFDAVIELRTACAVESASYVSCYDPLGTPSPVSHTWDNLIVGETYYVRIFEYDYNGTPPSLPAFEICLTHNDAICTVSAYDVPEEGTSGLSIYPNPGDGMFYVAFEEQVSNDVVVSVCDLLGRTILFEPVKPVEEQRILLLNIIDAPAGIYILSVTGKDLLSTKRISISR